MTDRQFQIASLGYSAAKKYFMTYRNKDLLLALMHVAFLYSENQTEPADCIRNMTLGWQRAKTKANQVVTPSKTLGNGICHFHSCSQAKRTQMAKSGGSGRESIL